MTPKIQLGARLVHKEIVRTIEDVGVYFPGIGEVYVIGNPGEGLMEGKPARSTCTPQGSVCSSII